MILLWQNLVDTAVALTPTNALSTLPVANIQNAHISRTWGTATSQNFWRVIIDFGTPRTCGVLAVLGTNMNPGTTLAISASNSDPAGITSPVFSTGGNISAGMVGGYRSIYFSFTNTSARYWRVEAQDTLLAGIGTRVGRIVLGPKWVPTQDILIGATFGVEDSSRVTESFGGQEFVNQLPKRRTALVTVSFMPEAEMFSNAFAAFRTNGVGTDMLLIPQQDSAFIHQQSIWGLVRNIEGGVTADQYNIFRASISIRERL